ncbi:alpha-hydroxy acid oxidase [Thermodesulfobacteriota bacterium]
MSNFESMQEVVLEAYRKLNSNIWDHITGGSESETALRRNRQALDSIAFRPRVLRDVSRIDTSTNFLGQEIRIPLLLAPIGSIDQIYPQGAELTLEAARDFGIYGFQSSINPLSIEDASSMIGDSLIFQLYIQGDDAWTDAYLDRIAESNCRAFCLTVDLAYYGRRERDRFNRYAPPGRHKGERDGFQYRARMTWDLVDKAHEALDIPVIVKGIATAEDARIAVEHSVEVIYVSNHGGRQLDHGRGCIEVLPEIVEAVDNKAEVVVDGGFMRGTDILKAIAIGARAVGIGKLQAWALAADGKDGVRRMLEILEEEISISMGLLGVNRLDQLDTGYLHPVPPVKASNEFSAFPYLERLREGNEFLLKKDDST